MPPIAFSQAITVSGRASSARAASPFAMTGATNARTRAPTAVVTSAASAIAATTSASCVRLLMAR